jgi:hypothetical protein
MSRTEVTYPAGMLPKALDPEMAEVIVCQPPQIEAGDLPRSVMVNYQLSQRTKHQ